MTNSKRLGAVLLGALVVAAVGTPAGAADVSAGADLYSAYIWRGITLGGSPVVQPWMDVSGIKLGEQVSFGFNVWSNVALSDYNDADTDGLLTEGGQFNEFDVTFTLTLPKGFKAGYIEYTFPYTQGVPYTSTREIFGSWAYSGIVNVGVNAYYDIGFVSDLEGDGTSAYGSLSVGKGLTINDKTTVSVDGLIGLAGGKFARAYFGTKGGFYNYNLSAKLAYKATEKVGIGAVVGYAGSLDEEVLPEQDKKFYAGANFSVGF